MKVGDRIRVFEITQLGQEFWNDIPGIQGKQIAEKDANEESTCVYLCLKGRFENRPNFLNYKPVMQAKHVCTMVITKLK